MKRNLLFVLTKEQKKLEDCRSVFLNILFSSRITVEDAKISAKSTDAKHAILVTSHTLNQYSLDS